VTLDAYWIDQTEVTNAMYAQCVTDGPCTKPYISISKTRDVYYGNSAFANYPVIFVDWNQANAYCQWAGRELPTEAQWEKAARGTDGRTYPWGNNTPSSKLANFNSYKGDTTAVGAYPNGASQYGAFDMAGNVWEWVAGWYGNYPSGAVTNPVGPSSGEFQVYRGGSWFDNALPIRAAFRGRGNPTNTEFNGGFRCAMDAD
jgi:serine/threonine-protein kinase